MLRLHHSLMFPRLTRQGETTFKSWSESSRTTNIYKLDWSKMDAVREDQFVQWRGTSFSTSEEESQSNNCILAKFPGTLPPKYDEWVKGMLFSIPQHYLEEIRRTARDAQTEWGMERHFDTNIREECLEPAISLAYVAFKLVSDCLYDPEANYFYRGDDKVLAPHAMLYKFWAHQTGRGMIKDHAKFSKIEHLVETRPGFDDSKSAVVRSFLEAIDEFEKDMNKAMEVTYTETGSSGPSIEITTDSTNFTTTSNAVEIEGDVVIRGNLEVKGKEEDVTVQQSSRGPIYITKDADGNEIRKDAKGKVIGRFKKVDFKDKVKKALMEEEEIDLTKINDLVTERDLKFEGSKNKMGLEILRSQWSTALFSSSMSRADAFGAPVSNRNVNCGNLRSLGKTQFLQELLEVLSDKCPLPLHMVVARAENLKEYKGMVNRGVLDTLTTAESARKDLMGVRGLLLSDEVHDAHIMERFEPDLAYYFGFFSEGSKGIRFEIKEGDEDCGVEIEDDEDS